MRNKISLQFIYNYLQIFYIYTVYNYWQIRFDKHGKCRFCYPVFQQHYTEFQFTQTKYISTIILPVDNGRLYKTPIVTVIHKLLFYSVLFQMASGAIILASKEHICKLRFCVKLEMQIYVPFLYFKFPSKLYITIELRLQQRKRVSYIYPLYQRS